MDVAAAIQTVSNAIRAMGFQPTAVARRRSIREFLTIIDTAAIVNQATEMKRLSASVAFDQTLERKLQRC